MLFKIKFSLKISVSQFAPRKCKSFCWVQTTSTLYKTWIGIKWSGMEWKGMEWDRIESNELEWNNIPVNNFSGIFPGLNQSTKDRTGLDWIRLNWIGLDWIGLDRTGLDWMTQLDRIGLGWIGLVCICNAMQWNLSLALELRLSKVCTFFSSVF